MAITRKHHADPGAQRRVWGYCRVSTDRQADSGISLDEQQRKIEARCLENGWALEHVFVDAGVSGGTPLDKRPQGSRLLATLRPGDVIIAAKMDRCFRSALDALQTIAVFKRRGISLWLLDLGGDVSGNGISELIMTVLAAVAQFERSLISERIQAAKANLRRNNRHQGGRRPFGFQFGEMTGNGRARDLVPDPEEQAAIANIIEMRQAGGTLMQICDRLRRDGFDVSHQLVANVIARSEDLSTAKPALRWPPGARDRTAEAIASGETLTIIGAPRP